MFKIQLIFHRKSLSCKYSGSFILLLVCKYISILLLHENDGASPFNFSTHPSSYICSKGKIKNKDSHINENHVISMVYCYIHLVSQSWHLAIVFFILDISSFYRSSYLRNHFNNCRSIGHF